MSNRKRDLDEMLELFNIQARQHIHHPIFSQALLQRHILCI